MSASVELADPEPNGLAQMLAGLLEGNGVRSVGPGATLPRGVVELHASDAEVMASIRFSDAGAVIANGGAGDAHLRIRGGAHDLLTLVSAPLVFGLPDPLRRQGRDALRLMLTRRVRISGMLRHPVLLARVTRLLSAA